MLRWLLLCPCLVLCEHCSETPETNALLQFAAQDSASSNQKSEDNEPPCPTGGKFMNGTSVTVAWCLREGTPDLKEPTFSMDQIMEKTKPDAESEYYKAFCDGIDDSVCKMAYAVLEDGYGLGVQSWTTLANNQGSDDMRWLWLYGSGHLPGTDQLCWGRHCWLRNPWGSVPRMRGLLQRWRKSKPLLQSSPAHLTPAYKHLHPQCEVVPRPVSENCESAQVHSESGTPVQHWFSLWWGQGQRSNQVTNIMQHLNIIQLYYFYLYSFPFSTYFWTCLNYFHEIFSREIVDWIEC